ncbi:MAG TPA: TIGR00282 family metallophosphoesterase [Clostridiales bacterium]|nr:TIGR00282 family metallophosphoesterase [Clostridiales bacterium]
MNILAIGDTVGSIGCDFLRSKLPQLKKLKGIDLVIANGENSSDGNGITPASAEFLYNSGVDVITTGNHSFRRREAYPLYDESPYLIRPANFPQGTTPGKGMCIVDMGRVQVAVINVMGNAYLEPLGCPFETVDRLLAEAEKENAKIIIVDFHAEATGEKRALGYYLDGRVSGVFGTHTHVQTADETVLPRGTGYITDVGMTGPIHSVLGVKPEIIIKKFKEKLPQRFDLADGACKMDCILFEVDEKSGKTLSVERIEIT